MLSSTLHVSHLGGPPSSSSAMLAVVSPTSLPHLWPRSSVFVRVFYFGVCTKMLVAALFFAVILVPVVIVLLFRGGIAFIALRLCRRSAAEWHNSVLANACVPRGGWSLPHKIEVCASLLSEFTYGFLLYLLHLCSGPVFATGARSRHALPVFFFRIVAIADLRRPFGLIAQLTFFATWSVQLAGMRCAVCLCIQPRHAVDGLCLPSSAPLPTGFMLLCSLAMC